MEDKLKGKIAVIIGDADVIDLDTAKRFVSEGAYVFTPLIIIFEIRFILCS